MSLVPDGFLTSESDSEPDFVFDNSRVEEVSIGNKKNNNNEVFKPSEKKNEYDFDLDIKELLDSGDLDLLKEAVESSAVDVNHCLVCSFGWSLSLYAASMADYKLLRWLVTHGGKVTSSNTEPVSGFLVLAIVNLARVTSQCILETALILREIGETMDKRQSQMKTPLMLASTFGNTSLVEFLVENKVDLDATDSQHWSALMYSADNGHGQVVRLLLEAGANPNLVSSHGYTAADLASINGHDQIQELILKFSRAVKLNWKENPTNSEKFRHNTEMTSILSGLGLANYLDNFENHHIGIYEYLVMSEEEMKMIGIAEVGARKRLLEGQAQVHKRTWSKQSVPCVSLQDGIDGLRMTCVDAAAILQNLSSHAKYLRASVAFIRLQLRDHGQKFIKAGSDIAPLSQLQSTLTECRKDVDGLDRECHLLSSELFFHNTSHTEESVELIQARKSTKLNSGKTIFVAICFGAALAFCTLKVWS